MAKIHEFLAGNGTLIHLDSLQRFVMRIVHRLGASQARRIGVKFDLLVQIRKRHGLPIYPRPDRVHSAKRCRRFDPRHRRRRKISLAPEPTAPPASRLDQRKTSPKNQLPSSGLAAEAGPTPAELAEYMALSRVQLWETNQRAVKKIRSQERDIITNYRSTCVHIKTRREYTAEDLQEQFGLTYTEAQTCFLTLDPPAPR